MSLLFGWSDPRSHFLGRSPIRAQILDQSLGALHREVLFVGPFPVSLGLYLVWFGICWALGRAEEGQGAVFAQFGRCSDLPACLTGPHI